MRWRHKLPILVLITLAIVAVPSSGQIVDNALLKKFGLSIEEIQGGDIIYQNQYYYVHLIPSTSGPQYKIVISDDVNFFVKGMIFPTVDFDSKPIYYERNGVFIVYGTARVFDPTDPTKTLARGVVIFRFSNQYIEYEVQSTTFPGYFATTFWCNGLSSTPGSLILYDGKQYVYKPITPPAATRYDFVGPHSYLFVWSASAGLATQKDTSGFVATGGRAENLATWWSIIKSMKTPRSNVDVIKGYMLFDKNKRYDRYVEDLFNKVTEKAVIEITDIKPLIAAASILGVVAAIAYSLRR